MTGWGGGPTGRDDDGLTRSGLTWRAWACPSGGGVPRMHVHELPHAQFVVCRTLLLACRSGELR